MRKQIETDLEFQNAELMLNRISEKLKATFSEEQLKLFERYEDNVIDEYNITGRIFFRMGMKVGIRVVAEGTYDG